MDFPLVLENSLFPVQAFFNAMPGRALISTLEGFSRGVGAGFNDAVCEFPGEVEIGDDQFEGVKFSVFSEELVISNSEFLRCLAVVCRMHAEQHPEDIRRVTELMKDIAEGLGSEGPERLI